jgi:hypothetical protein
VSAQGIRDAYAERGAEPPIPAEWIATASIALDLGLAIQHSVDPEEVPLDVYPAIFELFAAAQKIAGTD